MSDMIDHLSGLPSIIEHDFSEFGETETVALSKIQRLTGSFLGRNWVTVPHVTHHDEVDVTEVEARRVIWNEANPEARLTPAILLIRAVAEALTDFPIFNASLSADGKSLTLKKYVNIGVAVDTPKGLVVPVLRNVGRRHLTDLGNELTLLATKARAKGLSMTEMSGGSITVSSLGHIGGTAFTPIINLPEVAIVGATALQLRPLPSEAAGVTWRKMLPLSLSYDHRIINGADAARFVRAIGERLNSMTIGS
uniref:2-oxo acid dehydrogenase subunit E2 n=1 Tax=uncultured Sphingomonas sp. TaxID=158754 RepID=UPI0035C98663